MPQFSGRKSIWSGVVAFDSTGDKWTFQPVVPVLVHRVMAIVSVLTSGAVAVFTVDHERLGGAALTPAQLDCIGPFTVPITAAAGPGVYKEAADFTDGDAYLVLPGEQLAFTLVGGGATAGDGILGCEYQDVSFVAGNFVRPDGVPLTAPADTTLLGNMTKVTA